MSLFLVNRYLGEEEDGSVSKEAHSLALLAQLQQKAKDKQRQNRTEQQQHQNQQNRGCRKRKSEAGTSGPSDSERHPAPTPDKRRKKTKLVVEEAVGPTDTLSGGGAEGAAEAPPQSCTASDFTILGGFENKPVQKVLRVLPQWLSEPDVIHRDIKSNLVATGDVGALSAVLLKKLAAHGIHHFFPVQAEVIPAILEGAQQGLLVGPAGHKPRDICVSAPTGSGKTLAFVIPVVQVLMQRTVCEVRALAVLPTKELAQQVCKVFSAYCEGTTLRVLMLAGQRSFAAEQASLLEQRRGLRRTLADIVVATPGRLVDHINKTPGFRLDHLRFLIIDEADRMMDSMQQCWLSQVVDAVHAAATGSTEDTPLFARTQSAHVTAASLSPPQMPLQKLLFSATLTQNPEKLQQLGLQQPRLFSSAHSRSDHGDGPPLAAERYDFPQGLTEYYVPCTLSKKPLLMFHFLLRLKMGPILCFTNSKEAAHRLYLLVQLFGGVQAAEFSSRLSPSERKKTLKDFEQGKIQLLISTDAAARGIDIEGIKCVVNYDAPQFIRTYIHRIGRTARAGKAGLAFTFLLGVQEKKFLQMVVEAGSPGIQRHIVKPDNLKSMESRYQNTLRELAAVIRDEGGR